MRRGDVMLMKMETGLQTFHGLIFLIGVFSFNSKVSNVFFFSNKGQQRCLLFFVI